MVFATLVQLIGLYRQEQRARTDLDHRDFYEWLVEHRFQELKDQIEHTYHLSTQVDQLLREDHAVIIEKLDVANGMLTDIVGRMEGFGSVASVLAPNVGLSDDAIDLLQLLAKSKEGELFNPGGEDLLIVDANQYRPSDPRFLHDDLQTLVTYGLLAVSYLASGEPFYRITRRGAKFAELLPPDSKDKGTSVQELPDD